MNRFPQICVREQYICSDQFTRVPRHSAIGGTSELGQSDDWRLPEGECTAFGQIVFMGDSPIVGHALPAYHPRSVITREVVSPRKRDSDVRTPEMGVETGSSTAKTPFRPRALFLLFRLFFFFFFTVDYACLVVKSGVQRTPMGKPLTSA